MAIYMKRKVRLSTEIETAGQHQCSTHCRWYRAAQSENRLRARERPWCSLFMRELDGDQFIMRCASCCNAQIVHDVTEESCSLEQTESEGGREVPLAGDVQRS